MKNLVISFMGLVIILYTVMTHSLLNSKALREAELRDALSTSVSQTMEEAMGGKYGIGSEEEVEAAFLQSLLCKINSNIDLMVNVLELDLKEGLFDVEVIAAYEDIKGQKKEYRLRRTVIAE